MSNSTTYQLIKDLAEREKLEESQVVELFISAIQEIYRQKTNDQKELRVIFDTNEKQFLAYQVYQIVEKVNDPNKEISTESELLQNKQAQVQENCLLLPLDLIKITSYEEILRQFRSSLQKSQQKKWYEEFLPLQGKIVEGVVRKVVITEKKRSVYWDKSEEVVQEDYCLVNLAGGKGIGYWGRNEWLSSEIPKIGKQRRFLIKEVKKEGEHAINIACRHETFLRKLLEIEIKEIKDKKVIVKDILRQPGIISKIIVFSEDLYLNAKGTCIGQEGNRIKIIRQEMEKERVEFAEWKENQSEFIAEFFLPVKVLSVCKLQGEKGLIVIVSPEQRSLALSAKGKIIQLIENYLKVKIQVLTWEEIDKKSAVVIEVVRELKNNYPKL